MIAIFNPPSRTIFARHPYVIFVRSHLSPRARQKYRNALCLKRKRDAKTGTVEINLLEISNFPEIRARRDDSEPYP